MDCLFLLLPSETVDQVICLVDHLPVEIRLNLNRLFNLVEPHVKLDSIFVLPGLGLLDLFLHLPDLLVYILVVELLVHPGVDVLYLPHLVSLLLELLLEFFCLSLHVVDLLGNVLQEFLTRQTLTCFL